MAQNKTEIRNFLEPVQFALFVSGAAILVRFVSGIMHQNPNFICFKLDLKNAFNEMSRRAVLDVLEGEHSIKHLVTFAATIFLLSQLLRQIEMFGGKCVKEWGKEIRQVEICLPLVCTQI